MMKAIVYTEYGAPDVLELQEVAKPTPQENEILIKVYATTVTAVDSAFRQGKPMNSRLYAGLTKPKNHILGSEFAGIVEAVGPHVTAFKVGDEVFGATPRGFDAHAEYICQPEDTAVIHKPENVSFEEAAAICAALTALPFLRDNGEIKPGQSVLINGASGSIGTFAVQLAKYYGADVTGVCSTRNVELVKSLGADKVIDYSKEDFAQSGDTYDIIFDVAGKSSFSHAKKALKENGRYLTTVLSVGILLQMGRTALFGSKKAIIAFTGLRSLSEQAKDLQFLKELVETGEIKPIVDRCYPFSQITEAHAYADKGHKQGNIVVAVANSGA
jgi:NADPH:quinone reductase-like Zn-dependent oxidoreductase